jgi:hypothetical protein
MEYQLGQSTSGQWIAQPRTNGRLPNDDWKARAITIYHERRPHEDTILRMALADRVYALTGIAIEEVWVDRDEQVVLAMVDSILFRYAGEQLTVLRPCALCGSGRITSPPLRSLADVGYALSAWQPRHPECQPDDSIHWHDSNE